MPDFGEGSARDNYGELDQFAPSLANGGITPEQWAEYQRQRRRSAILGLLGSFGATVGLGAAGAALGGGGAAAGSATVPGVVSGSPLGVGTVTASGAPGALAGAGAAGAAGGGGATGGAASGLGAASGAAGAASSFMGLSPSQLAALALGGASAVGGAMSNRNPTAPTSATTDPNMQKLIATMQGRLDQSEPLYKSIMAMANGLLPTQYQNGGAGR